MFFLDFFCGGTVSCSSVETRWAPMLGGNRKFGYDPEHKRRIKANVQVKAGDDAKGDKGSPKNCSYFKSCPSSYTCPRAPFIGRRRDFYIPTLPLNSKNIPSVNTHKNVFYISYIYKSATSSHVESGLFETTTLTLLLARS
jgi:hypothetical protein